MSRARRRDRRVYLASHPVLFTLLALTRGAPVRRLGGTWLVHGTDAYHQVLTKLPLDRLGAGTTGAVARELLATARGTAPSPTAAEVLFDQQGDAHRAARRDVAADLGAAGLIRLRPLWQAVLERRLAPLRRAEPVELVDIASELAGVTAAGLLRLGSGVDPRELAAAARAVAAVAVREHLPRLIRRRDPAAARLAAARLSTFLGTDAGRAHMIAVAAVNTTVAGLPRAVAWCADARLWHHVDMPDQCAALVAELLRVTAPAPLLPRAAATDGTVAGRAVRAGERLVLVARHAAAAHDRDPDPVAPSPQLGQLVFGAGSHACPGAPLARAQLEDTLRALAPYHPVVVRARADRRSALPGWASLVIGPGR